MASILPNDFDYIIQTCFNFRTEYIFIRKLDVNTYLTACGQKFSINFEIKQNVHLYNQNNAEITGNRFEQIVSMFWQDACFCVNLVIEPVKSQSLDISPKDLQTFLIQRNCGEILTKSRNTISETDRKTLIKHAHAYVSTKVEQVEKHHIVLVAKTLVYLMPSLGDKTTEGEYPGFGLTFAFLFKKCKNYKYSQKAAEKKKQMRTSNQGNKTQSSARRSKSLGNVKRKSLANKEEIEENLKHLKTIVVTEENIESIKLKLKVTAGKRMQFSKNKQFDFLENFPFFFTHPKLILYDFTVHFPNADADGLMNKWQNIGSNINNVLTEEYNTKIYTEWSAGVEQVLALLKILPAKAGRNTKSSVLPFVKAIDKLIVHYEVSKPPQKNLDENVYPYIIACGPSKENLTHFYVVIENHLVYMPVEWNFLQVLDLFIKIHMNFNIQFECNIAPAMKFLGYYMYKLETKEFEQTLRARNFYTKFQQM